MTSTSTRRRIARRGRTSADGRGRAAQAKRPRWRGVGAGVGLLNKRCCVHKRLNEPFVNSSHQTNRRDYNVITTYPQAPGLLIDYLVYVVRQTEIFFGQSRFLTG